MENKVGQIHSINWWYNITLDEGYNKWNLK